MKFSVLRTASAIVVALVAIVTSAPVADAADPLLRFPDVHGDTVVLFTQRMCGPRRSMVVPPAG